VRQLDAGADAVQIFDSWAGGVPPNLFDSAVIAPTKKIVDTVRRERPGAKIIGFPRAVTQSGYAAYVQATGVDALSVDTATPLSSLRPLDCALQGNLDPIALIAGGDTLDRAADNILAAMDGRPHIFNLGHGILPETPIAHVEHWLKRIRK
jgi:uroporphyrinogen decarboxylase